MPDETPPANPDFSQFIKGLDRLAELSGETNDLIRQSARPADPPPPTPQEPDFDSMTQKELASWLRTNLTKDVVGAVQEAIKPLQENSAQTAQQVLEERYAREISDLSAQHKDFPEWEAEMIEIVKQTPGITPLRAYNLVRMENPDKAKKLDEKHNPPAKQEERPFQFGGLTPRSTEDDGTPGNSPRPKQSPEQANAAAFNRALSAVKARHPGVFDNLH